MSCCWKRAGHGRRLRRSSSWPGWTSEKPLGAVLEASGDGVARWPHRLAFDGGTLLVAERGEPGKRLRLRIGADDILLAREEPRAISANNVLPVTIADVRWTARGPM